MKTDVLKINPTRPQPEIIAIAARTIRAGRLVVFPTETVYGVGADALNPDAVQRIFAAKERPASDPLIVHIGDPGRLPGVARDIPAIAWSLVERFWPGPLTLVLPRHPAIPTSVTAGRETVAVRMPRHPVALALLRRSGTAIAAPSANLFTRPSPTAAAHVLQDLAGRVDLILDAGPPDIGLESTVVDLTTTPPALLRPGGSPVETLLEMMPTLDVRLRYLQDDDEAAAGPGMLAKHYSPTARVILIEGADQTAVLARMRSLVAELAEQGQAVGLMVTAEDAPTFSETPAHLVILGSHSDLRTVGQTLFAKLRHLEAVPVDVILVRALPKAGLGLAIRDRLVRAAEGQIISVD